MGYMTIEFDMERVVLGCRPGIAPTVCIREMSVQDLGTYKLLCTLASQNARGLVVEWIAYHRSSRL